MRWARHSLFFLVACFVCACHGSDNSSQELKTLDSLGGAINATIREFEKTDTVVLQKAVRRFTQYRQFIRQNINDTVTKEEADNLQHFYSSGKKLATFRENRLPFLEAARQADSQLLKLAADIKSSAVTGDQARLFIQQEKTAAGNLCEMGTFYKELFYTNLEEFKTSLRGVEQLIRSRNNGQLPVIIKDTLSL